MMRPSPPLSGVLAAFAIILLDLLGRAGLDKVLALSGGPARVALWAQLQSVAEMVNSVALAGVLQGLTVLVAQAREPHTEGGLLRAALRSGLAISLAVAAIFMLSASWLAPLLTGEHAGPSLLRLAALNGGLAVIPATLNAYWLGKHMQLRMLGLAALIGASWLVVAVGAWAGLSLPGLLLLQCGALLLIALPVWRHLRRLLQEHTRHMEDAAHLRKLRDYIPVGLAIGIMSPLSMLLIRGMLSGSLSWGDVGFLQALWRTSDWVSALASGMLSLIFLPRLSGAYGTGGFGQEMRRAAIWVLLPSACLLLLIYLGQRPLLAILYDARFAVSDTTAALFLLGCWLRIASWLFLYGLFATHRTLLIVAGEALSLPLLALLLWLFAEGMTLERAALIYLVSYLVYLAFNAVALRYALRGVISPAAP